MAKLDAFNSFLRDRLIVFAEEIFQAVHDIVSEQRDEIKSTKEENSMLRKMLADTANFNKDNTGAAAQTNHPEEPASEQQNSSCHPFNAEPSLTQVKMELCFTEHSAEPQPPQHDAPLLDPPSSKSDVNQRLSPFVPIKKEECEGLCTNSYLTVDLVPCDAPMAPNSSACTLRNERVSGGTKRSVNEKEAHACPHCPLSFSELSLLMSHLESHEQTTNSLCCPICNKNFKHRMSLKTHMVVHQRIRPFRCSFCGKGFKAKNHLREHERIHTGEKPYACSICQRCFTQLNHAKRHVRGHHKVDLQVIEKQKKKTKGKAVG